MNDLIAYSIRVFLVFTFIYFGTRVLTKKALAEMTAYEIAGIMILANVAAEPLVDKVVVKSVYGSGLIILLILFITHLALVNKFTPILEHTPTIIITNGIIDMKALKKLGLSLNQLEGNLRQQGYSKLQDIQYAILEPQGTISVTPKSDSRPIQPKDLNILVQPEELTIPVIMDGRILHENLKHIKLDKSWLMDTLRMQGIHDYKNEVLLAELNSSKKLTIHHKQNSY